MHVPRRLLLAIIGTAHTVACSNSPSKADAGQSSSAEQTARIEIDPNPICPECKVELQLVVRLGASKDYGPSRPTAYDSKGRWYTISSELFGKAAVFGKEGGFIQTIGRNGMGPGEYKGASHIAIGPGDSIYLHDAGLQRMSVFSPTFEYVRSFRSDNYIDYVVEPGGKLVGSLIGSPPKVVNAATGESVHTLEFSKDAVPVCRAFSPTVQRSRSGKFWSAENPTFTMAEFDIDGRRLREVAFRNPPAWYDPCLKEDRDAQFTAIHHLWYEADKDRLWLWGIGPGEGYKEYLLKAKTADNAVARQMVPPMDFHVIVIDLPSKRVLAATTLNTEKGYIHPSEMAPYVTMTDDETDMGGVKVLRAVLVGEKK
jgi:hypothetical protein